MTKTATSTLPAGLRSAEWAELRDLRELYADTAHGGLFVDRVGGLLRANPAARRLLQLPHLTPGALLLDLLPTPVRKDWSDFLRRVLQSGVAQSAELLFPDPEQPRLVRLEGALTRDGQSVRVLARSVVTPSEQMLQRDRLFELSQDLLCIADTAGYFRQVNPAWTHWLGWSESELLSRPYLELVHPDDRRPTEIIRADLQVRPIMHFRNRYRHKNGHYEWLSWNAEGASRGGLIFAVARIVTAEHNAEAELFRANAMRVAAEQLAGVAAWEYDPRKGVLLGMAQVRQLVGLRAAPDCMNTARALEPLPAEVLTRLRQQAHRCLRRGEDFDVELTLPTPRGQRDLRIVAGRHRSEEGHWRLVGAVHDLTELRSTEQALRRSEARWNAALESAGDGVWDWDVATGEITFSDPWASMLHYDPATLSRSAEYWGGRVHPEDIGRVNESFLAHAADAERPYRVEYRILDGRGQWRWVLARGRIIERAADGVPLRMIGTQSDIQAQKDVDRALQAWQQRLRQLVDSSDCILWEADPATLQFTFVSARAERLLGYSAEQWLEDPNFWRKRLHPADAPAAIDFCVAQTAAGQPHRFEYRMLSADGREIWIEDLATPEVREGRVVGLRGAMLDITERKRQQLRAAGRARVMAEIATGAPLEQILRTLVELLQLAITDGVVCFALDSADAEQASLVSDPLSAAQRSLLELLVRLPPVDETPPHATLINLDLTTTAASMPLRTLGRAADAGGVWLHGLQDADGESLGWLFVLLPQARDPAADELDVLQSAGRYGGVAIDRRGKEALLAERNRELEMSSRQAQALAQAKTDFLANMSHEMRSPLAVILGYCDRALASESASANELREALARISQSAQHMLAVVNDVLDAAHIDSGQVPLNTQPVCPVSLCEEVAALYKVTAESKGLQLRCDIGQPLPTAVIVDPLRLRQVLINLLGNAIKFTDTGTVELRLTAPDRTQICIDVLDTGIGLGRVGMDKLFKPFVQGDGSRSRRHGGTGLGLYISRALIERMDGSIQAATRTQGGSRFSVRLPVDPHIDWRASTAPPAPVDAAEEQQTVRLQGHVLVAEDDDLLRELLQTILLDFGLGVDLVGNGQEAVEAVAGCHYDAVLMDMHMPVMDGRTAARKLRELGFRPPIIALSADVVGDSVKAHLDAGCSHVLPKPASRAQLHAMLSSCLAMSAAR